LEFVHTAFGRIGTNSTACKHHIANRVRAGVGPMRIDEFPVVGTLFLYEKMSDVTKSRQACGEVSRI
jgi:hypothetical protein